MKGKKQTLTSEQIKRAYTLDKILFSCCTNKEQSDQMLRIMKQRKKLCVQPTTATHSA